jgi:parallel beta helix pectate lyase-like protein
MSSGRGCTPLQNGCGFPNATNTGVPAGATLKAVPGQVSSGPGWTYSAATRQVNVTGHGAVLSGLAIACTVSITASDVTITDDKVVTGGTYGIITQHTADVTIENSTVSGLNKTSGRVDYAIDDLYSDSAGLVIKNNNVADWRIGVNVAGGRVTGNYIHDPGYIAGDHTDGFFDNGGTLPLTIRGNTILDSLSEVDAIFLASRPGQAISDKTISDNLLAGGGYAIYAGGRADTSSNIVIRNNRFSQLYYPMSGQFGAVTDFDRGGQGNTWSANIWTGHAQLDDIRPGKIPAGRKADTVPLP